MGNDLKNLKSLLDKANNGLTSEQQVKQASLEVEKVWRQWQNAVSKLNADVEGDVSKAKELKKQADTNIRAIVSKYPAIGKLYLEVKSIGDVYESFGVWTDEGIQHWWSSNCLIESNPTYRIFSLEDEEKLHKLVRDAKNKANQ